MYNTKFILADGKELYPGYFGNETKQRIREKFDKERQYMRCGCRPEAGLYYRISEDLRIYPEHNNYKHDVFCCRYKDPSGEQKRQTAYVINDENGDVVAFTSFDPLVFTEATDTHKEHDNTVPEDEDENMEEIIVGKDEDKVEPADAEKKEPKLSVAGLIRSINVDSFTERAVNGQKIDSKEKFSIIVYHRMKKVKLARAKKSIGELTLEKDGCRFVYLPFAGVLNKEENGIKRCYLQTKNSDGKVYNNFVFPDTMAKAYREFIKAYGIEPNEHTMIAGFQYLKKNRSGRTYKVMGRVHLFQTTDIGLYCRSIKEVEAFNALQSLMERERDIKYWIPPEDENLGAIVEVKGAKRKILLLFRNKKDERISYDKSMYVPFVVDSAGSITKEYLWELANQDIGE